jgi:hypothetical protein
MMPPCSTGANVTHAPLLKADQKVCVNCVTALARLICIIAKAPAQADGGALQISCICAEHATVTLQITPLSHTPAVRLSATETMLKRLL